MRKIEQDWNKNKRITIESIEPDSYNPETLSLKYNVQDDHGIASVTGTIRLKDENGETIIPSLETNQYPEEILLPH